MSDEAYSSFLDQANQDTGASKTPAQSKSKKMSTKAVDTEVPAALQNVEVDYTSESDEPFEPVSLKWEGKNMPKEFGDLIDHKGEVSTVEAREFDPQDQYRKVLQAVEMAGDGKARIFRVQHGKTRVVYYVVGLDAKGGKVVGLKAMAVES
ncbi:MAG: hypothetical protein Q9164_000074 [Protoblastenia rupestris]